MVILKQSILLLLFCLLITAAFALPRMAYVGVSLAVPGGGEMLLGHETRAGTLMAIDVLAVYALIATNREIDAQQHKYQNYANIYADVPLNMPAHHYQAIQDYLSSDEYNDLITMMGRNYYLISNYNPEEFEQYISANIYTGDEEWAWDSDAHWQAYKKMRKRVQKTKMNHSLSLGIVLLNRVASAIDSAILSGRPQNTPFMYFSPAGDSGLMMNLGRNF